MGPENSDSLKVTSLIFNNDGTEITADELKKLSMKSDRNKHCITEEDLYNQLKTPWYQNIFD